MTDQRYALLRRVSASVVVLISVAVGWAMSTPPRFDLQVACLRLDDGSVVWRRDQPRVGRCEFAVREDLLAIRAERRLDASTTEWRTLWVDAGTGENVDSAPSAWSETAPDDQSLEARFRHFRLVPSIERVRDTVDGRRSRRSTLVVRDADGKHVWTMPHQRRSDLASACGVGDLVLVGSDWNDPHTEAPEIAAYRVGEDHAVWSVDLTELRGRDMWAGPIHLIPGPDTVLVECIGFLARLSLSDGSAEWTFDAADAWIEELHGRDDVAADPTDPELLRDMLVPSHHFEVAGSRLLVAYGSELICLDPATGARHWRRRPAGNRSIHVVGERIFLGMRPEYAEPE